MTHVERVIGAGLGVRPVTRVKTTSTIVDKLIATMTERGTELAQQREETFAEVARLLDELA